LANRAVAIGCSARLTWNLRCTVQVRSIMSSPSPPFFGMYSRMIP
jgi:hypothetical protein